MEMTNIEMPEIFVVDSMMGTGKTSAAINYMNSADEDTRFLYITPYLSEVERIIKSCPNRKFKQPSARGAKLENMKVLLNNEYNIVSTHALFKLFDNEVIDLLLAGNYVLIMDEVADVVSEYDDITSKDLNTMLNNFADIDAESGIVKWTDQDYHGKFDQEKRLCELESLVCYKSENGDNKLLMWMFPIRAFLAFKKVYILTYMFDAQMQSYYYKYYGVNYNKIGVTGNSLESYRFTDTPSAESKHDYQSLINILHNDKLNNIGDPKYALSYTWHTTNAKVGNAAMQKLKNNITNYFRNIINAPADDIIWTTFKSSQNILKGKGYTKGFIPINMRASNAYHERTTLAYPVNRFVNKAIALFMSSRGITIDEDGFALSEMLQFIWRSAIRDGKSINIYIPSSRMRGLLEDWIKSVSPSL